METLLSKVADLGYEFFGIILPGLITSIFLGALVYALGPLVPVWTMSTVPQLTIERLKNLEQNLTGDTNIVVCVLILVFWYFIGIILKWISRCDEEEIKDSDLKWCKIVRNFLKFSTPKPTKSYQESLEKLFVAASSKFPQIDGTHLQWEQFYPVAKSYLNENLKYSSVSSYQNKYTLHRSIATASAFLFWFTSVSIIAALITSFINNNIIGPNWLLLVAILGNSVVIIIGFARSYLYNWRLFGDMIVTETYSKFFAPKAT